MELKKMKPLTDDTAESPPETVGGEQARKRRNPFNTQRLKEEKERRQKKRARLIVRNISYKSTEDSMREHFGQWGTLEDVHILKRGDGKLVGCAFVQYETINQATKAILHSNGKELLGRKLFVDWALGKDEYVAKNPKDEEPEEKKPKVEVKEESGDEKEVKEESEEEAAEEEGDSGDESEAESESNEDEEEDKESDGEADDDDEDQKEDKDELKSKLNIENVKKEKQISNDVQQGCTVFIKNVPFDAEDADLRKVCRKFGLVNYAIINRQAVSGHSKGTAFVKFKAKESADLCLQAGTEFKLMDEVLDPHPALSREEMKSKQSQDNKKDDAKDSRNLYLAREGLIMSGAKAADGVSASDMAKRHQLEQVKTQVLKNLNRFVSRNRLSIHNLPQNYDNEKLKQMAQTYTGFRPHECRVMREQKITPEHPQGKSKGFGFLSFDTHQRALTALRKLNNNPSIFGTQNRPIVAFSIEDRAVHKIKEKRTERSKLSNPTYQNKQQQRKEQRQQKRNGQKAKPPVPQTDNKAKLQKHIKKLEASRAAKVEDKAAEKMQPSDVQSDYVGTAAKPGTSLKMRSKKKIIEQSKEHMKKLKTEKRKQKNKKIRESHLAERKANNRPKQGRKKEKDDLRPLINKYKNMISGNQEGGGVKGVTGGKIKKPKRTKWYTE
ncbi:LOW QUALITY PROTEIN: RNA-binding protein 28 [Drosophila gunungcola]|uniref:LOW QUALITY PROTEIN: RNA-binding protein 28 n=1 Tax=Drosophila gunungcola TaxID=103775 RepID=UPI0022E3F862|nr:LOW QUALITY PROTEIN: RNA-binding protein 28 [Drosophila gunungcola]